MVSSGLFKALQICSTKHHLNLFGIHPSMLVLMREGWKYKHPPLSIATYSFIQLSELEQCRVKYSKCDTAAQASKTGSRSREFDVLRLSLCALQRQWWQVAGLAETCPGTIRHHICFLLTCFRLVFVLSAQPTSHKKVPLNTSAHESLRSVNQIITVAPVPCAQLNADASKWSCGHLCGLLRYPLLLMTVLLLMNDEANIACRRINRKTCLQIYICVLEAKLMGWA